MSRIRDIFDRVRDKLGDQKAQRWNELTLMRLLVDGLDDISIHTKMFTGVAHLPLVQGHAEYVLPDDLIELSDVLFKDAALPLVTVSQMNSKVGKHWRSTTTEHDIQYAVYDKINVLKLRLYPRPIADQIVESYVFEPSVYGIDISIEGYESSSNFGLITDIVDEDSIEHTQPDLYGFISDVIDSATITVIYTRHAAHPEFADDTLELPPIYDRALVYYIVGMALRNDLDAQNRAAGAEELKLYLRELSVATDITSNNATNTPRNTRYSGIG